MYDVAVIGAGPAGATFARLIGSNYRVLLVERRESAGATARFGSGKCCGGLLAPDAQKMLSALGLGLPKKVLEDPQLFVVKAIDLRQHIARYYQRHYINMDRQEFVRWLLSMLPGGVDIRLGCRLKSYSSADAGFELTLADGNRTLVEKARILVGADGASSAVRAQFAAREPSPRRYIAIQEWVECRGSFPHFTSLFDAEITDYYCWTIPKGEYLIIGAALEPREGTAAKFELLKHKLRQYGFEFGRTVCREGAFILRPARTNQLCTGGRGIALLGEAGGWISPSSAEGLSYAFRSAVNLAESLRTTPDGFEKRYAASTRPLRRNIFLKKLKALFIFQPWLRRIVMRSGLQSMQVNAEPRPK